MSSSKRTDKPIMNFVIEPDLLAEVDNYRYQNKIPTRAEAIRLLLKSALEEWKSKD